MSPDSGLDRRACLAGLGAVALAPLLPAAPALASGVGSAAASGAGQGVFLGVFLAGGWVLTAEDLARLGPAAPPAIPLA